MFFKPLYIQIEQRYWANNDMSAEFRDYILLSAQPRENLKVNLQNFHAVNLCNLNKH